jgi:alkanesulfonate monooxygenase SsuD/methylene tetrahydromethanopterin reductase-like flavin-dependent oxidoreductase (luciferase family)
MFSEQRVNYANGMGGVPIVGDPDRVAHQLADLSRAGLRGVSLVNYLEELPFFCGEVLPRLTRMGLLEGDLRHVAARINSSPD